MLILGLIVFGASTVVRLATRPRPIPLLDHWLYDGLLVTAALVCAWRPLRIAQNRAGWTLVALGIALYAAGGIWTGFVLGGDANAPYPSIADGLSLACYPCVYLGLVLLARPRVRAFQLSLWLDGATAALGASALLSAFVIERVMSATSGRFTVVATTLAYPVCDIVLLCLIATVASLCSWRLTPVWWAIIAGIAIFTAVDLVFAVQQSSGAYQEGTPLDIGWPAGVALLAGAAWMNDAPRRERMAPSLSGAHIVPALFTLGAITLLAAARIHPLGWLSIGLAVATLVAATLRTGLAFRELRTLAEVRLQAVTDDLTKLGNRRLLTQRLDAAARLREEFSLLVIDLDGFKEINDALGHASGDEVLIATGVRFSGPLGPGDLLVRLGGDEFAIFLGGRQARAVNVALHLAAALAESFDVSGIPLRLTASIGIVCAPGHGHDPSDLLRRADIAMYRAKHERTGHEVYETRADEGSPARLALAGELRTAITQRDLAVFYQPKAVTSTGHASGLEALVRWPHPERGLLGPAEFLTLAEQSGLMHDLTLCVLERALSDLASLRTRHPALTVAVNVSVPTLLRADFPKELDQLLAARGLPPTVLEIEITEDVLMTDGGRARILVGELRSRGITVSIDDFGTGYSSLRYLRDLEVDWLKVDQSFITGLSCHASSARIVESTIVLAHALGIRVVAEGVEEENDWDTLSAFGCDAIQGYLLTRPLAYDEISTWLDAHEDALRLSGLRAA